MPIFQVTIVNEHFSQVTEQEAPDVVVAWQKAITGAVAIAAEQVSHENSFFGAVITLKEVDKQVGRYVVALGVSPLKD